MPGASVASSATWGTSAPGRSTSSCPSRDTRVPAWSATTRYVQSPSGSSSSSTVSPELAMITRPPLVTTPRPRPGVPAESGWVRSASPPGRRAAHGTSAVSDSGRYGVSGMLVDVAGAPAFGHVMTGSSASTGASGIASPSTTVSAASAASHHPPARGPRRRGPDGSSWGPAPGAGSARSSCAATTAMGGDDIDGPGTHPDEVGAPGLVPSTHDRHRARHRRAARPSGARGADRAVRRRSAPSRRRSTSASTPACSRSTSGRRWPRPCRSSSAPRRRTCSTAASPSPPRPGARASSSASCCSTARPSRSTSASPPSSCTSWTRPSVNPGVLAGFLSWFVAQACATTIDFVVMRTVIFRD